MGVAGKPEGVGDRRRPRGVLSWVAMSSPGTPYEVKQRRKQSLLLSLSKLDDRDTSAAGSSELTEALKVSQFLGVSSAGRGPCRPSTRLIRPRPQIARRPGPLACGALCQGSLLGTLQGPLQVSQHQQGRGGDAFQPPSPLSYPAPGQGKEGAFSAGAGACCDRGV